MRETRGRHEGDHKGNTRETRGKHEGDHKGNTRETRGKHEGKKSKIANCKTMSVSFAKRNEVLMRISHEDFT